MPFSESFESTGPNKEQTSNAIVLACLSVIHDGGSKRCAVQRAKKSMTWYTKATGAFLKHPIRSLTLTLAQEKYGALSKLSAGA